MLLALSPFASEEPRLGQRHREDAALSGQVADAEGAGMRVDGVSGNGQSEPESAPVLVRLAECLEHLLLVAAAQTTTLVFDLDQARSCAHGHLAAAAGELHRVSDEVPERGPQDASIPVDPDRHLVERQGDSERNSCAAIRAVCRGLRISWARKAKCSQAWRRSSSARRPANSRTASAAPLDRHATRWAYSSGSKGPAPAVRHSSTMTSKSNPYSRTTSAMSRSRISRCAPCAWATAVPVSWRGVPASSAATTSSRKACRLSSTSSSSRARPEDK